MPFIGKENLAGQYALLDSITTNGSASYTMQYGGANYEPETERNMIVSVNGVTQAPVSAYTISGSTITFSESLTAADSIDYILVLGNVFDIGVPSDDTVGSTQLKSNAVTTAKISAGAVTAAKLTIDGDLIPTANVTYDLGSDTLRFKDLYLSGNTIVLGDHTISANDTHMSIGDFTVSNTGAVAGDGSAITALNASQLTSGTIPDARFPSALPAIDGSALTGIESLPASIYSDNADANTIVVNADGMTLTGSLVVTGNLQIDGTTTTINSTTLTVDDKNIVLASGAGNAAAADGAGITIDGASASFTYDSSLDNWNFNKAVRLESADLTVTGDGSSTYGRAYFVRKQVATNGMGFGLIDFQAYSTGTTAVTGARIQADTTSNWSSTSAPANLWFFTTPVDSTTPAARMIIKDSGNVGIGNTSPLYALTASETNTTASNRQTPVDVLEVQAHYAGGDGQPYGGAGAESFGSGLVFSNEKYASSAVTKSAAIYGLVSENSVATTGGGQLAFYTASTLDASLTEKMRILPNGNVGIGISNPVSNLHVTNGSSAGFFQLGTNAGANAYQYINFGGEASGQSAWQIGKADQSGTVAPSSGFYVYDLASDFTALAADTSGNWAIGTITPNSYAGYKGITLNGSTGGIIDFESNGTLVGEIWAGSTTSFLMQAVGASTNMQFRTNGAVRATWFASGKIKLGDNSSTQADGTVLTVQGSNYNQVNITSSAHNNWGLLLGFGDGTSTTNYHGDLHAAIINVQNAPLHLGMNNSKIVTLYGASSTPNTGRVGINVDAPAAPLEVVHTNLGAEPYTGIIVRNTDTTGTAYTGITCDAVLQSHVRFRLNGVNKWQWRVGAGVGTDRMDLYSWTAGADVVQITTAGNMTIAGTFTESSALRYKENVQDLEYNNIISQLKPKIYNKIGQEEQEVGLIAEDVEALDKTLVTYQEDGTLEGIKYTRLVPHLIAHIQKLEERLARIEHGLT